MRHKTIGFRPSDTIQAYIEEQQKQDKKLTPSRIIINALHIFLSDTNKGNEQFFKYPPNLICPEDHRIYLLETLIASCPTCKTRRVCPLWKRTTAHVKIKKGE